MVRVGGLFRILEADVGDIDTTLKTPMLKLNEIAEKVRLLVNEQYKCFMGEVLPQLKKRGSSSSESMIWIKKKSNGWKIT